MSDKSCGCTYPEPTSTLAIATHGVQRRVGARLTTDTARALLNYCAGNACSQSEALRRAIVALSASQQTPADQALEVIREILGLEPDADGTAIHTGIDELLAAAGVDSTPTGDGLSDTPDAPPPAQLRRETLTPAQLSTRLDTLERDLARITQSTLTPKQLAAAKKAGVSPAEFLARRERAVKRSP